MALHRFWWTSLTVILIFIGLYVVFAIVLMLFQSRLIFFPNFPTREVKYTPDEIGLSYEVVWFETTDGVKLSGWFIPAEKPRGVILFCHGNAGNISHRLESIQIFHRLGLSTFIFDYRGYGQSEGKASEKGTYLDAEAAWNYIIQKRNIVPSDIIIFGRSLGGSIAAWLAQGRMPKSLIIESTFTSIPDLGSELYPYLPVRSFARFNYNTLEYLCHVNCPVLVVHSSGDEMISISHGHRLFEIANEPKQFLEIKGIHNERIFTSAKHYESGLESFISKYTGKERILDSNFIF